MNKNSTDVNPLSIYFNKLFIQIVYSDGEQYSFNPEKYRLSYSRQLRNYT